MSAVDELLKRPAYARDPELFRQAMREAIALHCRACAPFGRWYRKQGLDPDAPVEDLARLPFLPVSIFKRMSLQSVETGVVRVLKSSATSSQTPSTVALDAITRDRQMRSLGTLMSALIGPKRRPFVVLDAAPSAVGNVELSARVAGMRGYLMMATETDYAMDSKTGGAALDAARLRETIASYVSRGTPVCLLGYTYMLYQHVVLPLLREGIRLELPPQSFVLHFGGWKRLASQAVDRARFNEDVFRAFSGEELRIRDIYGFTEQLGIIYPDDGNGIRTAPAYSEVFVRDPYTLRPLPPGESGLLQFLTPLPHSYPGISVLLDDVGRIVSRDERGTRFEVVGRAKGSEIRGCGDTLPDRVYEVTS
jgi:hypothetical protein